MTTITTPLTVEVIADDRCFRCDYDLRGVTDEQPCPECGLIAERSRRLTDELHHTRPEWLRRMSRGVLLVLLSFVPLIGWWPLFDWIQSEYWQYIDDLMELHGRYAGLDLAALMLLAGVLLLAAREGHTRADRETARQRLLLRLAACVPLVGCVILHLAVKRWGIVGNVGRVVWREDELMQMVALGVLTLGSVPLPILLFRRLRVIAHRARSLHLAEHCTIVGIGNAATLVYIPIVGAIYMMADDWGYNWVGRSPVALGLLTVLFVLASLFALWNFYLLVRFTIAFAQAARTQRRLWRAGDRAAFDAVD